VGEKTFDTSTINAEVTLIDAKGNTTVRTLRGSNLGLDTTAKAATIEGKAIEWAKYQLWAKPELTLVSVKLVSAAIDEKKA